MYRGCWYEKLLCLVVVNGPVRAALLLILDHFETLYDFLMKFNFFF